ncbi:MAG TPA: DNA polymerase III subunit gamma/tau [Ruminiclostridium sp.]|nr:DNA polymerase III subunit gamma/tau [Ruminiclostridium sp.]
MYQALYRKWRPRVFEDVAGQPNITATLKNEVKAGRIAHAYIFTGSRGTGKTTCAKILAKAVNCLNPHDGDPCNECENCRGIDAGSLLDVVEIDAASNNGVDSIRELREETVYTPASAKYRVYIIDEAHMLSTGAFNALLKTLEEPPAYVIFILATTEVHKIPATIMSRCQRFDFHRIPVCDIVSRLQYVSQQEKIELEPAAASMIARISDGGLRDALSLLDQCAGSGGVVDEELAAKTAGLTGRDYLFQLSDAVRNRDSAAALRVIDGLYASAKDVERLCEELIAHFRDLMVVKTVKDPFEIINCRTDEQDRLQKTADGFSIEAILHAVDTLQSAYETLKRSSSGRAYIETCMMRLCIPELDTSNTALLRRIEALEEKIASGNFAAAPAENKVKPVEEEKFPVKQAEPSPPVNTVSQKEITNPLPPKEGLPSTDSSADVPLDCWAEVLEALRKSDAPLFGVLRESSAIIRGSFILIDPNNTLFAGLIRSQEHQRPLVEAVRRITGKPYKVGIFKKGLEAVKKQKADELDEILENANKAGIEVREY